MNILALESGGARSALAAVRVSSRGAAQALAVASLDEPRRLSSQIIALIDEALRGAQWDLEKVDALCVGIGPGSWTGLRIGLATFKTLAQARALPLSGVPVFDALAQGIWRRQSAESLEPSLLLCALPSRAGELYGKIFECHAEHLGIVQPEWIGSAQSLADTLSIEAMARGIEAPLGVCGQGAPAIAAILAARGEAHRVAQISAAELAIEIALAGLALLSEGEEADPLRLQPLYLAPSAAERNLETRSGL